MVEKNNKRSELSDTKNPMTAPIIPDMKAAFFSLLVVS